MCTYGNGITTLDKFDLSLLGSFDFLCLLSVGVLNTPVASGLKYQLSLTHSSFKPPYHLLTSLFESTSPTSVIANSLFSLNPVNNVLNCLLLLVSVTNLYHIARIFFLNSSKRTIGLWHSLYSLTPCLKTYWRGRVEKGRENRGRERTREERRGKGRVAEERRKKGRGGRRKI